MMQETLFLDMAGAQGFESIFNFRVFKLVKRPGSAWMEESKERKAANDNSDNGEGQVKTIVEGREEKLNVVRPFYLGNRMMRTLILHYVIYQLQKGFERSSETKPADQGV
uniref:Uncharacterized protein n=1 Tax=Salix viminalis TaxID=40686 RepID=A0A6N2MSU0_SALVM